MDKNQATGLILLSAMLLVYLTFFAPEPIEIPTDGEVVTDSIRQKKEEIKQIKEDIVLSDSGNMAKYGFFGAGKSGTAQDIVLENEVIKVTLNSQGGTVKEVLLKKYLTFEKKPLILIDEASSDIKETINTSDGLFDLNKLYYQAQKNDTSVVFSIADGAGGRMERVYSLPKNSYVLNYKINTSGLDNVIRQEPIKFNWVDRMKIQEKEISTSRQKATVNFYTTEEDFDYVSEGAVERTEEIPEAPVRWASMKQKFFNASIITDAQFNNFKAYTEVPPNESEEFLETGEIDMEIPLSNLNSETANMRFYFGPNDYDICQTVTEDFEENVSMGWVVFRPINIYVIMPMFNFFAGFIDSYGIVILIIVFIIKFAVFPLTYKSYIGMAKMKVLKPEVDELKEQYKDEPQKAQQEQMKLMGKFGVSPASGCVPMLAQTPIWLAMFNFFPNAIQLRQESFLWADDLSTYDSIMNLPFEIPFYGDHVSLFTLLMTSVTLLNTYYNNQMNPQMSSQPGPMKYMGYIMPFMFLFFLNSFAAGLTYYYFVSTTISVSQQLFSKKFLINEEAIRAKLMVNKEKRAKKGGGLQERMMNKLQNIKEDADTAKAKRPPVGSILKNGKVKKKPKKL
jgi:YidC/Oxa1 family membrane protein insertase